MSFWHKQWRWWTLNRIILTFDGSSQISFLFFMHPRRIVSPSCRQNLSVVKRKYTQQKYEILNKWNTWYISCVDDIIERNENISLLLLVPGVWNQDRCLIKKCRFRGKRTTTWELLSVDWFVLRPHPTIHHSDYRITYYWIVCYGEWKCDWMQNWMDFEGDTIAKTKVIDNNWNRTKSNITVTMLLFNCSQNATQ